MAEHSEERTTYLRVVWNDHGHGPEPDWAYHLRMGDVDCSEAQVVEGEVRCEPAFGSCALPSGREGMHSQDGPFRGQPTHARDLEEA